MSKKINISESRVNKLVEDKINELDWKTYMNAGKKAADDYDDRAQSFIDATAKAYRDKYGAAHKTEFDNYDLGRGEGHNPNDFEETRTDSWYEGDDDNGDYWYGVTRTTFPSADDAIPRVSSEYAEDYEDHIFDNPTRNRQSVDWPWFEKSEEELSQASPEFRDVHNYEHGKSKYTKGKGWNEAVVHAVTENVVRVIRENVQDKIIAKSFIGKVVHTPWAGNQKIQKVDKDVDEDGTPVLVFSGMGLPFMNLTYDEAYCLLEDGVMDNIELVDFSNESIVRNVTENVIRLIKEGVEDAKWTCDEYNGGDCGFYTLEGKWGDYAPQDLATMFESIIADYIGRILQDSADDYIDIDWDDDECVFVRTSGDFDPNDGAEEYYKGYPLYLKLHFGVSSDFDSGVDGDYAYKKWSAELSDLRLADNGVGINFAMGNNDPRVELVRQAVDGIDWEKVKSNIKPCELEEEDTDFDWAEYEQSLADDAAEARGDRWREEGW